MPEKEPLLTTPDHFEKEIVRYSFRNQFAAVFFAIAILSLAAILSREFVHTVHENEQLPPAQFLAVGTVIAEQAAVLEQPLPTAARRGDLPHDAVVFILADRPQDWRLVRTQIKVDGVRRIIEGWVRRTDLRSPADIREPPAGLTRPGDVPVKVADVLWDADEDGRFEVTGKVIYLGDRPLRAVKLIITFYDEKSNAIDQRFTYAGNENTLKKSTPVPFSFVGISEKPFTSVTCRAECRYPED